MYEQKVRYSKSMSGPDKATFLENLLSADFECEYFEWLRRTELKQSEGSELSELATGCDSNHAVIASAIRTRRFVVS